MMDINTIKEYFDTYILKYSPYEDRSVYSRTINFLLNYYLEHTYDNIPSAFKSLYENQQIPVELYDSLLLSNGFPEELVKKISFLDKYIILFSLMDYNRYKGTVELMRKISNSFNESFNLYELFIDYDIETNDWVFIPYLIYANSISAEYAITEKIPFDAIVPQTKHFFISKEYLYALKEDQSIIFPIKTNLLFTDYKNINQYSEINKLIFAIVFHHFKQYKLAIYFEKGAYQLSFENAYKLWYYIFLKIYPATFKYMITPNEFGGALIPPLFFDINKNDFPFTINEIPKILDDYKKIDKVASNISYTSTTTSKYTKSSDFTMKRRKLTDFYEKYLTPFKEYILDDEVDAELLIEKYKDILPRTLIDYIDEVLDPSQKKDDLQYNANVLINAIKNSLITWSYSFQDTKILEYNKYLLIFMEHMPFIKVNFNKTTSYYLLNFLKPYHAEFIVAEDFLLLVKNKLDSIYIDDILVYTSNLKNYTVVPISWDTKISTRLDYMNSIPIQNAEIYNSLLPKNESIDIYDRRNLICSELQNALLLISFYNEYKISFTEDSDININHLVDTKLASKLTNFFGNINSKSNFLVTDNNFTNVSISWNYYLNPKLYRFNSLFLKQIKRNKLFSKYKHSNILSDNSDYSLIDSVFSNINISDWTNFSLTNVETIDQIFFQEYYECNPVKIYNENIYFNDLNYSNLNHYNNSLLNISSYDKFNIFYPNIKQTFNIMSKDSSISNLEKYNSITMIDNFNLIYIPPTP